MSKRTIALLSILLGLLLGIASVWGFGRIERADAQADQPAPTPNAAFVAIAPGPGGMWIVYGNRVRICSGGNLPPGSAPPVPECSESIPLY
jgi:hypothetical protein